MIRAALLSVAVCLGGCVAVPASDFMRTCYLLDVAANEAEMAEMWHIQAGTILQKCGDPDAAEKAKARACYARQRNDTSEVCE